ncbi:hypothetical protein [Actinotalea sp. C106]|uniref:hypothetical protein n=1 Tax=Actinotalea sp. C106 TaxID=2908644 RepID=UPI0020278C68|nr:hypothetical protein [Actinotalea sp. C106]
MESETLPAFLDSLARRERAARRAVFIPLLIHTLALALVLALDALFLWRLAHMTEGEWSGVGWEVVAHDPRMLLPLLPLAVYLVLWAVARVRAWRTGVGPGHDGWGIMAIISLGFLVAFPWGSLALSFLGAVFFLGLGLTVLGARMREASLWMPGVVLMAVGPFANLGTFENHAQFLGRWPTQVALSVVLLGLAATTVMVWLRERRTLATVPGAALS